MNGNAIVGALLRGHAPLVAIVPVERIKAVLLPDGVDPPALIVKTVSIIYDQPLKRGSRCRGTARVRTTAITNDYRDLDAVLTLARAACGDVTGDVAGAERVAVLLAGTGPELVLEGELFSQAQDFRVSFDVVR